MGGSQTLFSKTMFDILPVNQHKAGIVSDTQCQTTLGMITPPVSEKKALNEDGNRCAPRQRVNCSPEHKASGREMKANIKQIRDDKERHNESNDGSQMILAQDSTNKSFKQTDCGMMAKSKQ